MMTPQQFHRESSALPPAAQIFVAEFLRFYKAAWPFAVEARERLQASGQTRVNFSTVQSLIVNLAWRVGVDLQFALMTLNGLWLMCDDDEQRQVKALMRKCASDADNIVTEAAPWVQSDTEASEKYVASWVGEAN